MSKKPRKLGLSFFDRSSSLTNLSGLTRTKFMVVRTVPTQAWVSFVLSRLHLILKNLIPLAASCSSLVPRSVSLASSVGSGLTLVADAPHSHTLTSSHGIF